MTADCTPKYKTVLQRYDDEAEFRSRRNVLQEEALCRST